MTILSFQSDVVSGHVGHGAARLALQCLGHDVWAVPTVLLSHHPGHGKPAMLGVEAATLRAFTQSLKQLHGFHRVSAVHQGYLANAAQAEAVREAVIAVKIDNPQARFLCDPVFGDDDGAYGAPGVAEAMARHLIPLADIVTPNRFELASLTSQRVEDMAGAVRAARVLARPVIVATSIPDGSNLATIAVTPHAAFAASTPCHENVPHGTGDLLAALLLGHLVSGADLETALARATGSVDAVIRKSLGREELALVAARNDLAHAPGLSVRRLS
ncbi:MAG TPA: pyridoxal kinase [Micropepsaceae bacterium]|nr:pyridoxal kinase [Micropepsaceae bacterium]